ncbi:MAG: ATP-binding protein, partial [Treponema sp.]|nr:ATP-binding protein [Treponema sp.]
AKGALRCGIEILLARLGFEAPAVDSVVIAGSFGYHLNEESLINIGLLPPAFAGKLEFAGNTSLSGGLGLLLNRGLRERAAVLAAAVNKVELSGDPAFEKNFIKYLNFEGAPRETRL